MFEYAHSLSYHARTFTNVSLSWIPAVASKIEVCGSPLKSEETTASSVYAKMPLSSFYEARFISLQMSSYLAGFLRLTVRSTTDTLSVGTRIDIPVSLPLSSGITTPTAFAAPVDEGMILPDAALPPRQSLLEMPSTVF